MSHSTEGPLGTSQEALWFPSEGLPGSPLRCPGTQLLQPIPGQGLGLLPAEMPACRDRSSQREIEYEHVTITREGNLAEDAI